MNLLLYKYLLREILATFFATMVVLTGVLFLGRLIPFLDIMLIYDISAMNFFRISAYILPQLLVYGIPMAGLIAVILAITRMAVDHEILALKAAGLPLWRLAAPVVFVALLLGGITAACSLRLIPAGQLSLTNLFVELARGKIAYGVQQREFSDFMEDIVLYVESIDPVDQGQWEGVYLADFRDSANPTIVAARRGRFEADVETMIMHLELNDGSMHRTEGDLTQTITFRTYRLTLPLRLPVYAGGSPVGKISRSAMTQAQLVAKAEELGPGTERGLSMRTEFHKRYVLGVACFLLTVLGFPLGLTAGPGRPTIGIPLGLSVFIAYYVLLTGSEIAGTSILEPAVALWLPNFVLAGLLLYLLHHAARETVPFGLDLLLVKIQGWGRRLRVQSARGKK